MRRITPKTAQSHRQPPETNATVSSSIPATRNMMPITIPTSVIELCLNCRMTIEARIHRIPLTSHPHHHLLIPCVIWRASAVCGCAAAFIDVSIAPLVSFPLQSCAVMCSHVQSCACLVCGLYLHRSDQG